MSNENGSGNPLRGEVSLTGESGTTYTFRLGTNALARIQETLGESSIKGIIGRLSSELKGGDFSIVVIRQLVQAASTKNISDDEAGDVIDDVGIVPALGAISESLTKTLLGGAKNPQKGLTKKKRAN